MMKYDCGNERAKTLAVVGKGITFDSGGISIKPAEHMEHMRHDMTGAAAVVGFIQAAADLKLPVNIIGIFAATENLPSGSAYKPGDVFKTYQRHDHRDRQHRRRGPRDPVRRARRTPPSRTRTPSSTWRP